MTFHIHILVRRANDSEDNLRVKLESGMGAIEEYHTPLLCDKSTLLVRSTFLAE